jgi:peptide/nickel transport system permease protein
MPSSTHASDLTDAQTDDRPAGGRSAWRDAVKRLQRSRGARVGIVLLGLIVLAVLGAPLLSSKDPLAVVVEERFQPPGSGHAFGTDILGRDMVTRMLYGGRLSLVTGVISVSFALILGVPMGVVSGYYGGLSDRLIMRLVDIMLTFPGILLALVIVAVLGPSLFNAMIAVGISASPTYARVVRATTLAAKTETYIEAAQALGCSNPRIIVRHILPNTLAPLIVLGTLGVAGAMISAAALSFLGLGAQPPQPEWGALLSEGRSYLRRAWWMTAFPGLAIMVTVLAINLLGDGLRDALDPRLRT